MKYKYRNVKTGETVTTNNRVSGKNWELIEDDHEVPPEEEAFDEIVGEETDVDEVPAAKPKTTRRGKK